MKSKLLTLVGLSLALLAGPALAHHSASQYDRARPLVIKGQVKDMQWSNPHSWLEIEAAGSAGKRVSFDRVRTPHNDKVRVQDILEGVGRCSGTKRE